MNPIAETRYVQYFDGNLHQRNTNAIKSQQYQVPRVSCFDSLKIQESFAKFNLGGFSPMKRSINYSINLIE